MRTIDPESRETVGLLECVGCGHWWISPVPSQEDLVLMYARADAAVVEAGARESYSGKTAMDSFQERVLAHARNWDRSTCLEVGAGGGHLLRRLSEIGHRCYGIDPGQWVPEQAIVPRLEDIPADVRFDVFILQDVIEHLFDPRHFLSLLRERAAAGAMLFCSFPCNESRPARRYRGGWAMVRPFGHLHYFSVRSAAELLRRAGWSMRASQKTRSIPIARSLRQFDLRTLAYELIKGGRDQLNVTAVAEPRSTDQARSEG
ncbi:MAG TPA: class I SAM-dependent methyltransferase [Gemmatimonadaceae bacterium]